MTNLNEMVKQVGNGGGLGGEAVARVGGEGRLQHGSGAQDCVPVVQDGVLQQVLRTYKENARKKVRDRDR